MNASFISQATRDFHKASTRRELRVVYDMYFGPQGILNEEYDRIKRIPNKSRRNQLKSFSQLRNCLRSIANDKLEVFDGKSRG